MPKINVREIPEIKKPTSIAGFSLYANLNQARAVS